jgi:hypothetical protein
MNAIDNVVDRPEVRMKKAKLELFHSLKTLMGLSDWDITFSETLDNGNMGECWAEPEAKEAEIYVMPNLSAEDLRKVIIHELQHCHTAPIRDVEWVRRLIQRRCGKAIADELTGKIEKELWKREEETVCRVEEIVDNLLSQWKTK